MLQRDAVDWGTWGRILGAGGSYATCHGVGALCRYAAPHTRVGSALDPHEQRREEAEGRRCTAGFADICEIPALSSSVYLALGAAMTRNDRSYAELLTAIHIETADAGPAPPFPRLGGLSRSRRRPLDGPRLLRRASHRAHTRLRPLRATNRISSTSSPTTLLEASGPTTANEGCASIQRGRGRIVPMGPARSARRGGRWAPPRRPPPLRPPRGLVGELASDTAATNQAEPLPAAKADALSRANASMGSTRGATMPGPPWLLSRPSPANRVGRRAQRGGAPLTSMGPASSTGRTPTKQVFWGFRRTSICRAGHRLRRPAPSRDFRAGRQMPIASGTPTPCRVKKRVCLRLTTVVT